MRTSLRALLVASVVFVAACAQLEQFTQAPPVKAYVANVGSDKTVLVVPFNTYISQVEAAAKVEMALVNYGFNVKSFQVDVKDVERRSGASVVGVGAQDRGNGADAIGAEAKEVTIERYRSYEQMAADLTFEVLVRNGDITLKVVRPKDKSVVGVANFDEYSLEYKLEEFLLQKNLIAEKMP